MFLLQLETSAILLYYFFTLFVRVQYKPESVKSALTLVIHYLFARLLMYTSHICNTRSHRIMVYTQFLDTLIYQKSSSVSGIKTTFTICATSLSEKRITPIPTGNPSLSKQQHRYVHMVNIFSAFEGTQLIIDIHAERETRVIYSASAPGSWKNLASFQIVVKLTKLAQMYRRLPAGCDSVDKLHVIISILACMFT